MKFTRLTRHGVGRACVAERIDTLGRTQRRHEDVCFTGGYGEHGAQREHGVEHVAGGARQRTAQSVGICSRPASATPPHPITFHARDGVTRQMQRQRRMPIALATRAAGGDETLRGRIPGGLHEQLAEGRVAVLMVRWVQHHLAHRRDLEGLGSGPGVGQMQRARLRIALHVDRDTGVQLTDGAVDLDAITQTADAARHRTDRRAASTPGQTFVDRAQDERQPMFVQTRIVLPTGQQVVTEPRAAGAGRGDHRPIAAFPENDGRVYGNGTGRAVHRVSRSQ